MDRKADKKMDAVKDGHRKTNRLVTVRYLLHTETK